MQLDIFNLSITVNCTTVAYIGAMQSVLGYLMIIMAYKYINIISICVNRTILTYCRRSGNTFKDRYESSSPSTLKYNCYVQFSIQIASIYNLDLESLSLLNLDTFILQYAMCKFIQQIISTFVPIKTFSDLLMHFGRTWNFIRHISLSLATTRYDVYVYKIIMCRTFICLTF